VKQAKHHERKRKRILMICYHYPPAQNGGIERSRKFAKYLPKFGWRPMILTTNFYGSVPINGTETIIRTPEIQTLNKVARSIVQRRKKSGVSFEDVRQVGLFSCVKKWMKKMLFIPDVQIGWGLFAFWPALYLILSGRIDAIYSSSPPESSHVLALILKWITKKPWVADLRDPWTFEPLNLLLKTVKWRLALERRLERMVFNRADAIILNTPEAEKSYRKLYPRFDHKMQTITNGFDADEIRETNDELGENNPWLKYDNLFLISHIGSFFRHTISGFTPDSMLDAFQKLVLYGGLSPQNCRIVLAGHVHWEIKRKIEEIGLTDIVELPGYLSHKDALKLEICSNLLLVFDPNDDGTHYVRGKIYEYMGCKKTILGILPIGASRSLLEKYGKVFFASPDDSEEIRKAVKAAFEQNKGEVRVNADFKISNYDRKILTKTLTACLDKISNLNDN